MLTLNEVRVQVPRDIPVPCARSDTQRAYQSVLRVRKGRASVAQMGQSGGLARRPRGDARRYIWRIPGCTPRCHVRGGSDGGQSECTRGPGGYFGVGAGPCHCQTRILLRRRFATHCLRESDPPPGPRMPSIPVSLLCVRGARSAPLRCASYPFVPSPGVCQTGPGGARPFWSCRGRMPQ